MTTGFYFKNIYHMIIYVLAIKNHNVKPLSKNKRINIMNVWKEDQTGKPEKY